MNDTTEAVVELLDERPELREPLSRLLDLDEEGPWSFEDAPLDSGQFGEVVSRGLVVRDGDAYELANPEEVRRVLDADGAPRRGGESTSSPAIIDRLSERVDTGSLLALVVALVGAVVARVAVPLDSVFRDGAVVYTGNDPYKYRYLVDRLLSDGGLTLQSKSVGNGDALYIATLHAVADVTGGSADAVLSVTPVVLAVLTAIVVYWLCVELTSDRRVGVAAVALLSVTPVHAFRSSLGFVDHHAFDFFWLAVTLLGVIVSLRRDDGPASLVGVGLVGVGTAAQVLAWRGGPLLVVPLPVVLLSVTVFAIRSGERPLPRMKHVLGGVAVGTVITVVVHSALGWGQPFRVVTLAATLGGGVVLLVVGEVGWRLDASPWSVAGVTALTTGGAVAVGAGTVDVLRRTVVRGVGYFGRTGQSSIAETFSLFDGVFGLVLGPVLFFGFVFFLAVPILGWALVVGYRRGDDRWFAVGVYGAYLLAAASVQVRFAGALAVLTAVLGAVGFLRLLSWLSVIATPRWVQHRPSSIIDVEMPPRETIRTVVLAFLLISGVGVVQTGVKQQQIVTDDETFAAVSATAAHASQTDTSGYPESYVFSPWGENYEFNYFTSGWAGSYDFAQDYYAGFLTARTPLEVERERDRLRRHGTGYVAIRRVGEGLPDDTVYSRLYERLGSGSRSAPGLGQFRGVYVSDDGGWRVFEFVDGARIVGETEPGQQVTVTTNATVDGREVQYRRTVTANAYGEYGVTVPYPGRYTVSGEDRTLDVTDHDVDTGRYTSPYRLHLTMDDVDGGRVSDTVSGATAETTAARAVDGPVGGAVALDGTDDFEFDTELVRETESLSLAFWVRGNFSAANRTYPRVFSAPGPPRFGVWARTGGSKDFGTAVVTDDERVRTFGIKQARFDNWTHVAVVLDGGEDVLRLYRNGSLVSATDASAVETLTIDRFAIGGKYNFGGEYAPVALDDIRLYARPLDNTTITELSNRTAVAPQRESEG